MQLMLYHRSIIDESRDALSSAVPAASSIFHEERLWTNICIPREPCLCSDVLSHHTVESTLIYNWGILRISRNDMTRGETTCTHVLKIVCTYVFESFVRGPNPR